MKNIEADIGHLVNAWLALDTTRKIPVRGIIVEKYGIRVRIMINDNKMIWSLRSNVEVIQ